jgi:hypothetical protein
MGHVGGKMKHSFLIAGMLFGLVVTPAMGDDFCSQFTTVKDCAELSCHWIDEEARCTDGPESVTESVACDAFSTYQECNAQPDCTWQSKECVRHP